jgi:hypothetical protein
VSPRIELGRQALESKGGADMADQVANAKTSLTAGEVIVRAVQFFSTEKFKTTSQSERAATFEGRPPIPWGMILLTILGYIACVVPGIIMYFMILRKMYRFYSLVVTANPIAGGTEVSISYPDFARDLAPRFLAALPPLIVDLPPALDLSTGDPHEQP